jgi:uncharacterized RDD family membrane protein YckC
VHEVVAEYHGMAPAVRGCPFRTGKPNRSRGQLRLIQLFLNCYTMNNENNPEMDPLAAVMAGKTDSELAKIIGVDRNDYTPDALAAAKHEYSRRDIQEDLVAKEFENQAEEKENIHKTKANLASQGQRFQHLVVDMILIYGSAVVAVFVAASMDVDLDMDPIMDRILSATLVVCYYLGFESQLNTTPGKMLTRCTVVMENGDEPTFEAIAKRSLCRLIPFEALSFLGQGSGWHDTLSKTKVIRLK